MAATTRTTTSLHSRPLRPRMIQNYLLIWVNSDIDETSGDCQYILEQLRHLINYVTICKESKHCIKCLNDMDDEKAFIITSGALGLDLVPEIHTMKKVHTIYIFDNNRETHKQWTKQWSKIQDIFTEIKPLCESLRKMVYQCDHNAIAMSFLSKQMVSLEALPEQLNLNQLEPTFMYSVLFKEIILEIEDHDDAKSVKNLVAYGHLQGVSQSQLTEFQDEYQKQSPIWLYSRSSFLHRVLNRALRTFDTDAMMKMGFFIRNLHRQLEKLQKEQLNTYQNDFLLYRGQGVSRQDFQHLLEIKDGLLSFNNFLSTSKKKEVAMIFAESTLDPDHEIVGIILMMTINLSRISTCLTPFACIENISAYPQEDEILFSMHTVFRVADIKQSLINNRLWEVELPLTDDNDPQLAGLTKRMKEELCGPTGTHRMGQLMLKVGDFDQAEILYNELLKNTSLNTDMVEIYQRLGETKYRQGQYKEAILFCEKSLEINHNTPAIDYSSYAGTYNYIGLAYRGMGDHSKALEFSEKSLQIRKTIFPRNHPSLAFSYNNIGGVYKSMGDYMKALECYEKSINIKEEALPSNHPSLATSYDNIGKVYNAMGDYSKALEFYNKAYKRKENALPPNHPDLSASYYNIGSVHSSMGDYSKALEFYERGHKIREKSLSPNHPLLAGSHLNFAACYHGMGDYAEALNETEKAFQINQKTFEEHNAAFGPTLNWYGRVYRSMKEYTKSLHYFEKYLETFQKTLSDLHPNKALAYSYIGDVHRLMGNFEKALVFHLKALNIQGNIKCNPLQCATTYVNLGETYREMKDYTKALAYIKKGLDIREKKLPKNHSDLAVVYHNLSKLYLSTQEYDLAMQNVQQAIDIGALKLPSTHHHLVDYRETLKKICEKM